MSDTKHTPGPLAIDDTFVTSYDGKETRPDMYAIVRDDDDRMAGDYVAQYMHLGDAQLFCAASELLEELECALAHIRGGYSESGVSLFEFEFSGALSAIAKAKGESQ